MRYFLGIIGIVASLMMMKYREQVGSMLGQPAWADKVGGIYNLVVILSIILFFWSIAAITNTEQFLLRPLLFLLPLSGGRAPAEDPFMVQ